MLVSKGIEDSIRLLQRTQEYPVRWFPLMLAYDSDRWGLRSDPVHFNDIDASRGLILPLTLYHRRKIACS